MANTQQFTTVKLIKADATLSGNLAANNQLTTSLADYTFGGPTELWGLTWTAAEVNATNFGVLVGCTGGSVSESYIGYVTNLLQATNFSCGVPAGNTIDGIRVVVKAKFRQITDVSANVDHINVTIYYSGAAAGPALLKTVNGLAKASVKTLRSGVLIASGKTFNGLT
jgi:hypothetical protein